MRLFLTAFGYRGTGHLPPAAAAASIPAAVDAAPASHTLPPLPVAFGNLVQDLVGGVAREGVQLDHEPFGPVWHGRLGLVKYVLVGCVGLQFIVWRVAQLPKLVNVTS